MSALIMDSLFPDKEKANLSASLSNRLEIELLKGINSRETIPPRNPMITIFAKNVPF
jgi:hypothetical protein